MPIIYFLAVLAITTATASWLVSFGSRSLAWKVGAVAQPSGGRRIHDHPIPQLGGLGIGLVLIAACALGLSLGWFTPSVRPLQVVGLLIGICILMVGGFLDDKLELNPGWSFVFPTAAALALIATGTRVHEVTNPFGPHPIVFSAPVSYLLTVCWMLAVTAATKFADGLDGLVTGQTVIGAGVIAALCLSTAFYQPSVAVLAVVIGASFLGFLPVNFHPAKQFLGESGSTIAGFALGFLAIASGAKVATALMALGVPLADITFVMLRRISRGRSPFKGDKTHLHFRLLDAGLSVKQAVLILWGLSLVFGVVALGLQTRGKILLLSILFLSVLGLSALLGARKAGGNAV